MSTFLVYKVKKCLLKSGKVTELCAQTYPRLWASLPNYVGHGCPRLWVWIPIVLVTHTHVRGHGYPCTWVSNRVRGHNWCISFDISLVLYAVSLVLYAVCRFFMILLPILWYFNETSLAFFSEKYHSYKWLYIRYINWNFPEKWDFETFSRKKLHMCARVRATVNLKSTHSQLQKMGWGVFIVWTKTINW